MLESSHFLAAELELNSEALEVDYNENNYDCGNQVEQVGSVLSVESLLQTVKLIWLGEHEVEEGNDGSFELSSLVSSDGNW